MKPCCRLIAAAVATVLLAGPAFAQRTTESLSDAALQNELYRLGSYRSPEGKLRGYRGRVRSSDFEIEKQMQQLDKQRMADDQRQYNLILDELARHDTARHVAKQQAERDRYNASADRVSRYVRDYLGQGAAEVGPSA